MMPFAFQNFITSITVFSHRHKLIYGRRHDLFVLGSDEQGRDADKLKSG